MRFIKYFIYCVIIIFYVLLFSNGLIAGENKGNYLTLNKIIEISLSSYPVLKSNIYTITRDREMAVVERSLDNPQIEVMFDEQPVSSLSLGRGMKKSFKLSQMIPGPGKRSMKGREAEAMSAVSGANYEINRQNLIRDIKENYYMLYMARSENKIIEKSIAILSGFMSLIMQRYQLGLANQTDVIKLNIEIEKMKTELIAIKKNDKIFSAKLRSFMNRKDNDSFEIDLSMKTGEIMLSADAIFELAKKNNPDIMAASKMAERNQYSVELAKYARRPDFMTSVQYSNYSGGMQENTWTLMVGASLPIYRKKINAGIKAAEAELKSSVEMKNAMENDAFRMISEELSYVSAQNELINKYSGSIIPAANMSVQAAMSAYQNSQIDYESLVMTQQELFKFEMENIKAYIDYLVHFNMLERIAGTGLKSE
ncbi:MAG: TolC family protein [Candidatus Wallbacteria bacterium]